MLITTCCYSDYRVLGDSETRICNKCGVCLEEPGSGNPRIIQVSTILQKERQELLGELEKIKRDSRMCGCIYDEGCGCIVDSWNEALEDVKNLIKKRG